MQGTLYRVLRVKNVRSGLQLYFGIIRTIIEANYKLTSWMLLIVKQKISSAA